MSSPSKSSTQRQRKITLPPEEHVSHAIQAISESEEPEDSSNGVRALSTTPNSNNNNNKTQQATPNSIVLSATSPSAVLTSPTTTRSRRASVMSRASTVQSNSSYVSGITLEGDSYKKEFQKFSKRFPSCAEQTTSLTSFSCALERDILWQGKLYISNSHIGFYGKIFGKVVEALIDFRDVVSIEKKNTVGMFPNAIRVTTTKNKYVFSSLTKRDKALDVMSVNWKAVAAGAEPGESVPPLPSSAAMTIEEHQPVSRPTSAGVKGKGKGKENTNGITEETKNKEENSEKELEKYATIGGSSSSSDPTNNQSTSDGPSSVKLARPLSKSMTNLLATDSNEILSSSSGSEGFRKRLLDDSVNVNGEKLIVRNSKQSSKLRPISINIAAPTDDNIIHSDELMTPRAIENFMPSLLNRPTSSVQEISTPHESIDSLDLATPSSRILHNHPHHLTSSPLAMTITPASPTESSPSSSPQRSQVSPRRFLRHQSTPVTSHRMTTDEIPGDINQMGISQQMSGFLKRIFTNTSMNLGDGVDMVNGNNTEHFKTVEDMLVLENRGLKNAAGHSDGAEEEVRFGKEAHQVVIVGGTDDESISKSVEHGNVSVASASTNAAAANTLKVFPKPYVITSSPELPPTKKLSLGQVEKAKPVKQNPSSPLSCNCANHFDHVMLNHVFDLDVEDFYKAVFERRGESLDLYEQTHSVRGSQNLTITPWRQATNGLQVRELTYSALYKAPLRPRTTTPCTEVQTMLRSEPFVFVVESVTKSPKVPYGEYFLTKNRYCMSFEAPGKTRLIVTCKAEFSRFLLVRGFIERQCLDGSTNFIKELRTIAQNYIEDFQRKPESIASSSHSSFLDLNDRADTSSSYGHDADRNRGRRQRAASSETDPMGFDRSGSMDSVASLSNSPSGLGTSSPRKNATNNGALKTKRPSKAVGHHRRVSSFSMGVTKFKNLSPSSRSAAVDGFHKRDHSTGSHRRTGSRGSKADVLDTVSTLGTSSNGTWSYWNPLSWWWSSNPNPSQTPSSTKPDSRRMSRQTSLLTDGSTSQANPQSPSLVRKRSDSTLGGVFSNRTISRLVIAMMICGVIGIILTVMNVWWVVSVGNKLNRTLYMVKEGKLPDDNVVKSAKQAQENALKLARQKQLEKDLKFVEYTRSLGLLDSGLHDEYLHLTHHSLGDLRGMTTSFQKELSTMQESLSNVKTGVHEALQDYAALVVMEKVALKKRKEGGSYADDYEESGGVLKELFNLDFFASNDNV